MTGYSIRRLRISAVLITWGNYNHGVIYDEVKNTAAQTVWYVGAVAAFYTTRTTTTVVGLALGKIFISRLAHYNALTAQLARSTTTAVKEALQLLEQQLAYVFVP